MGTRSRWIAAIAASAGVLAFASGCGGDEPAAAGSGKSANAAAGGQADGVAKAKQLVEHFMDLGRKFPTPTKGFDPGTGKVGIVSCGGLGTDCGLMGAEARDAAKAMGWQPSEVLDGEFSPAKQAGFVQSFVRQGYDAIILAAIDAGNIKAAVDEAIKAHIPIACIACVTPPEYKGDIIDVTTGGEQDGEAVGAWVVAHSNGKAKILAYDDPAFQIVARRKAGAKKVIDQLCPECTYESAEFPVTEITKPGPPTWRALLSSKPQGQLDYVMGPYDAMTLPAAKTAQQLGRTDIKMTGFDAAPGNVQLMAQKDSPLYATSSGPYLYAAWAAMDQVARKKAGIATWDSSKLPVALVTKDNVQSFLGAKKNYFAPAGFREQFTQLWKGGQ